MPNVTEVVNGKFRLKTSSVNFPFLRLNQGKIKTTGRTRHKKYYGSSSHILEHQIIFLSLFELFEQVVSLSTYGKIVSQNLIFLSLKDIETKLKLG